MAYSLPECTAPVAGVIRFKGVFDYAGLAKMVLKWLYDRHYEVTEGKHKHKMSCPHGFEIEREFKGERKINDFIRYKVNFAFHLWDAFEVDGVKDGKKKKLWNARIEIRWGCIVEIDYQNNWDTPFRSKLLKFFANYIIKSDLIVKHMDRLYYDMFKFHTKINKFLGMEASKSVF